MQISLKWINELVNIEKIEVDNLIKKLTLGGFEVEEILELDIDNQKQIVLDISSTANRSDSLSIQGISIEISTLVDQPLKVSKYLRSIRPWKQNIENLIESIAPNHDCSTFIAITVENLTNINVPVWIKQKLISSGITPIDNLLDFQNYILLETGYPFLFYDLDKINSQINKSKFNLSISKIRNEKEFLTNDGKHYYLDKSISVINGNDLILSVAGISENHNFSYSETTTSLLIEGSIFNASTIRQQSRSLGLRTNRSARYEKSLKNTYLFESLYKLISLLRISNPTITCRLHTMSQIVEQISKPILLNYETIKEILGPIKNKTYLTTEIINSYLTRLNFNYVYDKSQLSWEVTIPHSRTNDITREIDLIEEIGRVHGFNKFVTIVPKINTIGIEDFSFKTRKKITACLLNLGLNELIHYSLVNETKNNEIKLVNPLIADYSSLRKSLLPNLIKTVQQNIRQDSLLVEGFEYGHVFCLNDVDKITVFKEKEYVAGIFGGIKTKLTWSDSEKMLSWFEAKGKIDKLFKQLNLLTYWKSCSKDPIYNTLHPYRSTKLYLSNGESLGVFGQIHPILTHQLNLPSEIYLFEFDIKLIENQLQAQKLAVYKEYSAYPKIIKDLSFIVKREIAFQHLRDIIYCNGTQFLSEIHLLDEYQGQGIPDQYTSLCLQLVFKSNEKTLQNKKIEEIISNLQLILTNKFNVILRD